MRSAFAGRRTTLAGLFRRYVTIAVIALLIVGASLVLRQQQASAVAFTDQVVGGTIDGTFALAGRGPMATSGVSTLVVLRHLPSYQPYAYVFDGAGRETYVPLPVDRVPGNDWSEASYAWSSPTDLWILSGGGPVFVRHYELAGSPLPTSARLVETTSFGNSDSRAGALLVLSSGSVLATWRQQGQLGPQGIALSYRRTSGTWTTQFPIDFMPTRASKQALVQNPSDGSIWLFSNADAWGAIGAVHLTDAVDHVRVDWADPYFISDADHPFGSDPENPDLVATADVATGTVVLAYQSSVRTILSTAPIVTGAHVAVARVSTDGTKRFFELPVLVERVSRLGLAVGAGQIWLAYRPVDLGSLSFDQMYVSRYQADRWDEPSALGRLASPYESFGFTTGSPRFAARMSDGHLHLFTGVGPGSTPTASPTSVTSPSPTPSPTASTPTPPSPSPSPVSSPSASPSPSPSPSPSSTPTASPTSTPTPVPMPTKAPGAKCRSGQQARCK